MSMEYTKEQFEKKFSSLPKEVRDVILAADTGNILRDIGKKHKLHVDQIGELMEAVDFVMLGILSPGDFIRDLYERMAPIDKQKVREIAHEVNERIFQKIRESLKQVHNMTGGGDGRSVSSGEPVPRKEKSEVPPNLPVAREETVHEREKPRETAPDMKTNVASPAVPPEAKVVGEPIISQKLGGMHALPKEESAYGFGERTPKETPGEVKEEKKPTNDYGTGEDPYRESIE